MAVYERSFVLRQMPINATGFTDVGPAYLPIACNTVVIINISAVDILLRTDPANANSEITIHAGQQQEIGTSPHVFNTYRFQSNVDPVCSLKSTSGNQTVIVESVV